MNQQKLLHRLLELRDNNCALKSGYTIIISIFLIFGCSFPLSKERLIPEPLKGGKSIQGTFTLILYGANHSNDLETIAILDREGDGYEFEPYAPEFQYKTKKHLPAQEALSEAEKFVSWHHSFRNIIISEITDEKGSQLGYEVRPLYYPWEFGFSDVLEVDYFKSGNKIITRIKLIESVEKIISGGGDSRGVFE
ncbi:MAG: hypothetical protein COZ31_11015 [Nitrospirae bacterium CG_4_10_14_3_um_filter_44_29]|nr:hypothetical protein [Nitrospirota bacterium]PIX87319.1 MAG: hypothetical protein COZ31_11015 [Nitrospirae bacterium CG_4_10_14_3_um_filter_44_29]